MTFGWMWKTMADCKHKFIFMCSVLHNEVRYFSLELNMHSRLFCNIDKRHDYHHFLPRSRLSKFCLSVYRHTHTLWQIETIYCRIGRKRPSSWYHCFNYKVLLYIWQASREFYGVIRRSDTVRWVGGTLCGIAYTEQPVILWTFVWLSDVFIVCFRTMKLLPIFCCHMFLNISQ